MNDELQNKWDAAEFSGQPIQVGRIVVCDFCDDDWTGRPESGGFIFQSKAVCPKCAPRIFLNAKSYGEGHLIRAGCPIGVSFADFVREYRGPESAIHITSARAN